MKAARIKVDDMQPVSGKGKGKMRCQHRFCQFPPRMREGRLPSEMGINAHIPRTPRFVIGVRASARHISASLRIPDGLRVTFTPQTFVKEVIHAAGQADIFGHVPGRAQANNTVWADRLLICSGNGVTLIIIFLRLLFAVPGEGRLQRNVLTYLPAQG